VYLKHSSIKFFLNKKGTLEVFSEVILEDCDCALSAYCTFSRRIDSVHEMKH
jgi:hypothetical protein